jgi:hypothetical protein
VHWRRSQAPQGQALCWSARNSCSPACRRIHPIRFGALVDRIGALFVSGLDQIVGA